MLEIEEYIQDLATRDTINHKIANSPSKYIAACYHNYYMKLTNLFNKTISNKESVIEVLIGIHLLILATEKGYIGNENGEDDIAYYKGLLVFFKEEIYLSELTKRHLPASSGHDSTGTRSQTLSLWWQCSHSERSRTKSLALYKRQATAPAKLPKHAPSTASHTIMRVCIALMIPHRIS